LKAVLVVPLGITADAGTTSPDLVDVSFTVVGAPGLVKVTVQFPPLPATTLVGLHTTDKRLGAGVRDSVVVSGDEPREALIVADPAAVTLPAVAVKGAEVEVAGTVTEA